MRLALLLATLVSLATRVPAPGMVKGWVVDSHGGVVPGVSILAVPPAGPGVRTVTDSTGHYELAGLPAETYEMHARLGGFVESARQMVCVGNGDMTGHANGEVIEVFKDDKRLVVGRRLSFAQENWPGERTPYAVGQDMVLFLAATTIGWRRVAGPQAARLLGETDRADVVQAVRRLAAGRKSG